MKFSHGARLAGLEDRASSMEKSLPELNQRLRDAMLACVELTHRTITATSFYMNHFVVAQRTTWNVR
jgi:hypothetical protein